MLDNQKELFIVVDKNDKIIGYRTRYDCHHDKKLIHRAVGIIVFNNENKILLQKRSMLKDMEPGKYEISSSGHVAKGQTYEAAALRELEEELGITVKLTYVTKFICEMDEETEIDMIFTAKHKGPFIIAKDEIEYVRWFNKKEIVDMKDQLTFMAKQSLQNIGVL